MNVLHWKLPNSAKGRNENGTAPVPFREVPRGTNQGPSFADSASEPSLPFAPEDFLCDCLRFWEPDGFCRFFRQTLRPFCSESRGDRDNELLVKQIF